MYMVLDRELFKTTKAIKAMKSMKAIRAISVIRAVKAIKNSGSQMRTCGKPRQCAKC